ncbi:MAG TPA: multicopper oxidase domain-containing protein [Roseiflexaceae bacterium]|jgi:nitrite reductase (NO-forming)|nr:multicopper oxidase domain-containing protein [Roseiflexaceae bacterium]
MDVESEGDSYRRSPWPFVASSAVRAAFGVIWAIDAALAWQPAFADHYVGYLQNAIQGQPAWLEPWFTFWITLVTPASGVFVWATRIVETIIAIGLLLGLARKWIYLLGGLFSLLLWSTAEGFGGPYTVGAANLGPTLVYALVFAALIVLNYIHGATPYSLDFYLAQRFPAWQRVAEWSPRPFVRPPPRLSWFEQAGAIVAMVVAFVLLFGSLESALNAAPATPANAAAAVSPLSMASAQAGPARDARLPPLINSGDTADITITASDATVAIANGVTYQAWTFDGTAPGPVLHVRQGQTVNVTFVNNGKMQHSVDFHAAETAPNVSYRNINAGETLRFSFVANTPGVFVYHCGTAPVLLHMANGMYGAIVVDPAQPLPPADISYVIVQSEWYTRQVQDTLMAGNYNKMMAMTPDEVVFNGIANQYHDHPLAAKANQRVRLYVVDAGPSLASSFHVIGAMFAAVYPDGDAAHALTGVSTYPIAPGQGVVFDLVIPQAGKYPFVDHSMRNMAIGAVGELEVTP